MVGDIWTIIEDLLQGRAPKNFICFCKARTTCRELEYILGATLLNGALLYHLHVQTLIFNAMESGPSVSQSITLEHFAAFAALETLMLNIAIWRPTREVDPRKIVLSSSLQRMSQLPVKQSLSWEGCCLAGLTFGIKEHPTSTAWKSGSSFICVLMIFLYRQSRQSYHLFLSNTFRANEWYFFALLPDSSLPRWEQGPNLSSRMANPNSSINLGSVRVVNRHSSGQFTQSSSQSYQIHKFESDEESQW